MVVLIIESDDPLIAQVGWCVGVRGDAAVILMRPDLPETDCLEAAEAAVLGAYGPVKLVAV